jgi:tRNA1(Val) A37 N6-methylase TrmN6
MSKTVIERISALQNHAFTHEYVQPAAYRFCQDSVIFPRWLAEEIDRTPIGPDFRALDVCAGCGVIGFELTHYLPEIVNFDFMEIQETFRDSFERNLQLTGNAQKNFRFVNESFTSLSSSAYAERYDLIVANPPYFFPGDGKLTPSPVKNRCRFFLDGTLEALVSGCVQALKPGGEAFVLVKTGERHGRDNIAIVVREAHKLGASAEPAVDIRGTWVMRLRRPKV